MTGPSIQPNVEVLLRLLHEGLLERIPWVCRVFEIPGPGPVAPLRSEFCAYVEGEWGLLRLRSRCDRAPAEDPGAGAVEFGFVVQQIGSLTEWTGEVGGSAAIRIFGALRRHHAWVLEMEVRRPLLPGGPPAGGGFDEFVDRVGRHSPSLWRWRMLSHEGAVRAVERRFETRFEDLRLTLHEFTEGTTGVVRCHAVAERTGSGDAPAPVFDPHEASVLVALVKRGALTARRARS